MSRRDAVSLDASTVLAFALNDDALHSQAVALIKSYAVQDVTFSVPALFHYECDSVIRLRVYKKSLTPDQARGARTLIEALPLRVEYDSADHDRAFEIAELYDQPRAYDAAYAAHAEARNLDLITLERFSLGTVLAQRAVNEILFSRSS